MTFELVQDQAELTVAVAVSVNSHRGQFLCGKEVGLVFWAVRKIVENLLHFRQKNWTNFKK